MQLLRPLRSAKSQPCIFNPTGAPAPLERCVRRVWSSTAPLNCGEEPSDVTGPPPLLSNRRHSPIHEEHMDNSDNSLQYFSLRECGSSNVVPFSYRNRLLITKFLHYLPSTASSPSTLSQTPPVASERRYFNLSLVPIKSLAISPSTTES